MGIFKNADDAMNFFKDDRFAVENGMRIDSLDGETCVCSMEITPHHLNAAGGVMGGAIFTLADFAFAVASNNLHKPSVAQQVSINYLNGAKGTKLFARTKLVKDGRTSCVVNVDVTDDTGRSVAQYVGTGFKLGV